MRTIGKFDDLKWYETRTMVWQKGKVCLPKVQIAMELKWWYFTCSNEFTLPPTYSTPWLVYDWLLLFTILFGGVYFILYKWQHGIFYYEVYF